MFLKESNSSHYLLVDQNLMYSSRTVNTANRNHLEKLNYLR